MMDQRVSMNVLFYIKRTKLLKTGEAPIYLRITVNGTRAEVGINRSILPKDWSSEKGAAKGNSRNSLQINTFLESIRYHLHEHLQIMRDENEWINARNLMDRFLGKKNAEKTILTVVQGFIAKAEKLIGSDYTHGTVKHYRTTHAHLKEFLLSQYNTTDFPIQNIDHEFIKEFEAFLKTQKGLAHNTAMNYIKKLKKLMRTSLAYGWIKQDPFALIRITEKKVHREFLSEKELKAIIEKDFGIDRLNQVRDCFLFSCFTGLAHSDLKKLSPENLSEGANGSIWIKINRTKTNNESSIPLLPIAKQIVAKYEYQPYCRQYNKLLPVSSNQRMNAYLKEIADLCGIKKKLTSHIARHTFATTVTLNNDIPFETVSKMLGHSNFRTTRIYAKLLDKKVGEDMSKLTGLYG